MASPSRSAEREEERRLNLRTLVIASAASATAALVTSQLWIAGTWIAAAMTPVIVALVSELLHRPTERITRGITSDRRALPPPATPPRDVAPPSRSMPGPGEGAPVRIYRSGESAPRPASTSRPATGRRKIAFGVVFGTAALAFVIAILVITVPELVAGGSIGKNEGRTTLFSGSKKDRGDRDTTTPQDTTTDEQEQPDRQQTTPEDQTETTPETETTPTETVPAPQTSPPTQTTPTTPAPTTPQQ